jgi:hypothetical protein
MSLSTEVWKNCSVRGVISIKCDRMVCYMSMSERIL